MLKTYKHQRVGDVPLIASNYHFSDTPVDDTRPPPSLGEHTDTVLHDLAGMSDAELADYRKREEIGHRPTWTFRSGRLDQFSAATRGFRAGRRSDPFGMFGNGEAAAGEPVHAHRRLTRLQTLALEAMSLDEKADAGAIRTRYAELVKRWHPDSNGGDRSAEAQLQRVIKAYQTLKASGLV